MIINHNMNAMNAHRNMSSNTVNAGKSMEKLSSGLRINKAGDDAAGLAISEKMRGQIRGLDQASRNAQDGISLIQTAEGALNETHSILQRVRELTVQASNDTATDDDRAAMQAEVDQLTSEIDRVGNSTQFNTKTLLDGSQGKRVDSSAAKTDTKVTDVKALTNMDNGTYSLAVDNKVGAANIKNLSGTNNTLAQGNVSYDETSTTAKVGETYTISWVDGDSNAAVFTLKDKSGAVVATSAAVDNHGSGTNITALDFGSGKYKFDIDGTKIGNGAGSVTFTNEMSADYTITGPGGDVIETTTGTISNEGSVDIGGFRLTVDKNLTDDTASNLVVAGQDLEFQIGANEGQTTKLAISDMRSNALGVENLKVNTQTLAKAATTTVDKAIRSVSEERGKLGALQNRLEHTIANLGTSSENLTSAESRVRDVDMAKEMMTFSKNNILSQAAQAMLAQANQQPQGVLQLLR